MKIKTSKGGAWDGRRETERAWREDFLFYFFFSSFLSHIYGNRTVDFRQSRRQSWTTRRELCIGTNILAFCQTLRGTKFSYLCYFEPKGYVMAWNFLRGRKRP